MIPASIRGIRAAFVFMTRLPVGGFAYSEDEFRWAPAHFPLVGLVVGSMAGAVSIAARPLGPFLASTLSTAVLLLVTGALHEDGLADSADALGGGHERARILEILKDSRIGTYGACALVLVLLLRIGCLAELLRVHALSAPYVLVLAECLSRCGPVCLMAALPYISAEKAKSVAVTRSVRAPQVGCALIWTALALFAAAALDRSWVPVALLAAATLLTTAGLGRWFARRAGGYTGDFLGATQQILDVVLLLGALSVLTLREARV